MVIRTLNKERGIISLYDGDKYIIYSTYYGVVAESSKIDRHYDDNFTEKQVGITFDICEWFGYWSLSNVIKRGITKQERQFISDKKVTITFNQVKGEQSHLKRQLVMHTERY